MNNTLTRAAFFALAILTLVMSLAFAACTGKQPAADPTAQPTAEAMNTAGATEQAEVTEAPTAEATAEPGDTLPTPEPKEHYLTYEEVYDPETDYNNDLGGINLTMLNTEDAYYIVSLAGNYLYYYDKQTGEYAVLCGKPECTHDSKEINEDCAGFVRCYGGRTLNMYQGKIYYDYTKDPIRTMYRMALDGTGKEKLFDFEYTYRYNPQRTAIHRGKLYGTNFASIVEGGEPITTWNITSWDLNTGEWKVIYEENTSAWPTMFFFGDYVYFCAAYSDYEMTEDGEEICGDTHLKLLRYDIVKDRVEKLLDVTGPDYPGNEYSLFVISENRVYATPKTAPLGSTSLYLIADGKIEEVLKADAFGIVSLFEDRLVNAGFEYPIATDIKDLRSHISAIDYEGNVLFEQQFDLDIVLGQADGIIDVSILDAFYADNAYFVGYYLQVDDEEGDGFGDKTILVKYELDGDKLEQTLIAVTNWN